MEISQLVSIKKASMKNRALILLIVSLYNDLLVECGVSTIESY